MARTRTSSTLELLVPLDRDSPRAAPPPAGARPARRDPDGRLPGRDRVCPRRARSRPSSASRAASSWRRTSSSSPRDTSPSRPGGATRVARAAAAEPVRRPVARRATAYEFDFRPGRPDVSRVPAGRLAARPAPRPRDGARATGSRYLGGHGVPELRTALATYLNRVRGTAADPADVVICTGLRAGPGARRARRSRAGGARVVAVEDPSDPEYRATLRAAGLESVAIPVDERRDPRGPSSTALDVDGVVVTAAHQYPTGARPAAGPPRARSSTGPTRRGADDRRGRLRRRVPLRPRADRRDPGPRARPRRLRRLGEQDPRPGPAPRLARRAAVDDRRADRRGQAGRRHGLGGARPAGVRGRARARRARPPPAPDAADLPGPPRRAARAPSPATSRTSDRSARPPGSTCSPGCPTTWTRRGSSTRRPAAGIALGSSPPRRIAPGPGGLIFGYGVIAEARDRAGRGAAGRDRGGEPGRAGRSRPSVRRRCRRPQAPRLPWPVRGPRTAAR